MRKPKKPKKRYIKQGELSEEKWGVVIPDEDAYPTPQVMFRTLVKHNPRNNEEVSYCDCCGQPHERHTYNDGHCTVCVRWGAASEGAKGRKKGFRLTLKQLADLYRSIDRMVCYYCGIPEQYSQVLVESKFGERHTIYRFGLDRQDSSLSYEQGNLVFCCNTCNIDKGTRKLRDYLGSHAASHQHLWISRARALGFYVPDDWFEAMKAVRTIHDQWNLKGPYNDNLVTAMTYNKGLTSYEDQWTIA